MSEEGEADFDAGQIDVVSSADSKREYQQRVSSPTPGTTTAKPGEPTNEQACRSSADIDPTSQHPGSSGERRSEYGMQQANSASCPRSPGWASGSRGARAEDDAYLSSKRFARSGSQSPVRSKSRSRSRSRDYGRRSGYRALHESSSRRNDYRADETDSRGASYRSSRYADPGRSSYSRRYEREPPPSRYRRRESGRGPYARPPGYSGSRDDVSDEDNGRRGIDKDKAIEELRMRVRASHERLPLSAGSASVRERSRSATRSAHAAPPPAASTDRPTGTQQQQQNKQQPEALATAASDLPQTEIPAADGTAIDIDDLEEGEHIEVETDKMAVSENARGSAEAPLRSQNRSRSRSRTSNYSRDCANRERIPARSRSRTRAYYGSPSVHEQESRRSGSYRDHAAASSDASYRRKYDEPADRRDYRSRDASYAGGSSSRSAAHRSRYTEAGVASHSSSRYSGARSPDPGDNAGSGYRSERRQYSGRYDRHYSGGSEHRQQYSPSRHRSQPRSRSPPSLSSLHVSREDERRVRKSSYGDRYHGYSSRPLSVSRSPKRHSRAMEADESAGASESANPPPPPPPLPHHGSSTHGQDPAGLYKEDSPYRGYPSSRSHRRSSRTPRLGSHGGSHSRPPYNSRYDYDGSHSREPSSGAGYYGGGNGSGYHGSRINSPDMAMHNHQQQQQQHQPPQLLSHSQSQSQLQLQQQPMVPEQILPGYAHGTDLYISRMPESLEWLEAREMVREQEKRVLEISVAARRTAFDLVYAQWNVLKAESQAQLAGWQLERAEQGLGSADRSLLDTVELSDV
ncbi:hypothetical protein H4R99_006092 [Coemansia sp. RSA 1722]|nr:hypothetical protein IWW45_006670 [Coemansia sp. RSA 485]KAJ2593429.1 hypothetical protein H4R99_006092 [Coemansia sp. RSA 1722]